MIGNLPRNKLKEFGAEAEKTAAAYLRRRGYKILRMNYHTRRGEIDIICMIDNMLVFVEVKSASKKTDWDPVYRIDAKKQQRMKHAANDYIVKNELPAGGVRFDAVIMTATERNDWKIKHIEDAFRIEDSFSAD